MPARTGQPLARVFTDWTAKLVQLRWLVGAVFLVMGLVGPGGVRASPPFDPIFFLALVILAYNLFFVLFSRGDPSPLSGLSSRRQFAFWQVTLDWLTLICLLFLTGGPVNPLAIFFVIHVLIVAIYLPPREALVSGCVAILALLAGAMAQITGIGLPKSEIWGAVGHTPGMGRTVAFLLAMVVCFVLVTIIIKKLGDRLWAEEEALIETTQGLERWRDRARRLNQVSVTLNRARDVEAIFLEAVEAARVLCDAPAAGLRLYDESTATLEMVASVGLSQTYLKKGKVSLAESPLDQLAMQGKLVAVPDLSQDPMFQYPEAAAKEGVVSVLCAPLAVDDKFFGVLRVYDRERRVFGPAAREYILGLAGLAAVAMDNASTYRELEKRDKMTRDFVVSATHALRSPLAATQNMLDLLLEGFTGDINEQQRDVLSRARRKNEHLLVLVRELLYLTSRDLDTVRTRPSRVNLARMLRYVVTSAREAAEEAGVALELDIDGGDHAAEGIAEELGQMMDNILQNAIKYTPRGGRVTVTLTRKPNGHHLLVEDTGIGISPEHQELVFQPFHRAPNARDLTDVGTGLGLTLVKRITERMKGEVLLCSSPGEGTSVHVWLPAPGSRTQPRDDSAAEEGGENEAMKFSGS